ncbi:MAG: formyltransferase family protein [bacterium]|nr:formyltransferase family protein [bacterium]
MKTVLCASDFFYPVHISIKESKHEVIKVFTSCSIESGFSNKTLEFANEMGAEFRVGQITATDIEELEKAGVTVLISAAYDYKIPTPVASNIKFINIHGSLLPDGRGPWPQPWILLKHPEFAGVTFHTMTQEWDHGDIILQQKINLADNENIDSLTAKTIVCVSDLANQLFNNFEEHWKHRYPMMTKGIYWKKPTEEDRTIKLTDSSEQVQAIYRAFGDFTLFKDPQTNTASRIIKLSTWQKSHSYKPGSLIAMSPPQHIYAIKDGYVSIIFTSLNSKY